MTASKKMKITSDNNKHLQTKLDRAWSILNDDRQTTNADELKWLFDDYGCYEAEYLEGLYQAAVDSMALLLKLSSENRFLTLCNLFLDNNNLIQKLLRECENFNTVLYDLLIM